MRVAPAASQTPTGLRSLWLKRGSESGSLRATRLPTALFAWVCGGVLEGPEEGSERTDGGGCR